MESTKAEGKIYTNSRCGLLRLKRFIESFTEEKCNLVKDLGLGGLLQLKIQQHRNRKIEELMKRFDPATRKLGVHGRELVITEDDVERILGLAGGRKDISRLNSKLQELRQKCKMRKDSRKELIANMEGIENNEEWQANFILLAIHCVLRPTSALYCGPASLEFIDDGHGLENMDWCRYVLDGLVLGALDFHNQLKNLEGGKSLSLRLKGCTLLLEIFYLEHVKCKSMITPWDQRPLPRIADWTDKGVKKVYDLVNDKLDNDEVELLCGERNNVPMYMHADNVGPNIGSRGFGPKVSMANLLARVEILEAENENLLAWKETLEAQNETLVDNVSKLEEELSDLRCMLERNVEANQPPNMTVEENNGEAANADDALPTQARLAEEVEPTNEEILPTDENVEGHPATPFARGLEAQQVPGVVCIESDNSVRRVSPRKKYSRKVLRSGLRSTTELKKKRQLQPEPEPKPKPKAKKQKAKKTRLRLV